MQNTPVSSLVGEEYEVEVGPVAHGGHCIARTEAGRVLFVRHALPGEKVVARVTEGEETSRFLRADAITILDPSKDRVEPPAPSRARASAAAATGSTPSPAPSAASRARSSPSSSCGSPD